MNRAKAKQIKTKFRKARTRAKIFGTKERPRLSVFRSNKYTYAQLIDDTASKTLFSSSTQDKKGAKAEQAKSVGLKLAESAKKGGVKEAVFDRGHYKYHGRVKAVAEGAREGGLKF